MTPRSSLGRRSSSTAAAPRSSGATVNDVAAMVLVGPNALEQRRLPRPPVASDGALVPVELWGVCGTDLKYFGGKLAPPYPLILGHEVVGIVEEIGDVAAGRYR